MGQAGEVTATAQYKNSAGHWVSAPRPQKATRWKARVYIRGEDGLRQEIVRFARTRREAEAAIDVAVEAALVSSEVPIRRSMSLLAAGQYWLEQISRSHSRLSSRTIADYTWTWRTYVDARTSSMRGLTLHQANDPQRLRAFLQRLAEAHGSASAKKTKSVLNGVLAYAVDSGVLTSNAMRQVRTVDLDCGQVGAARSHASHDPC
jgi:hypothetical protein